MKKIIIIAIVFVVIIISCCIYLNTLHITNTTEDEYRSKVEYYQNHKLTGSPIFLGEIKDPQTAAKEANKLWVKRYGIIVPIKEKPYNVAYDEKKSIWYITGTLRFSKFMNALGVSLKGGTAFLVVQEDGKVLAIGHE